jgi:hypothetical protein
VLSVEVGDGSRQHTSRVVLHFVNEDEHYLDTFELDLSYIYGRVASPRSSESKC